MSKSEHWLFLEELYEEIRGRKGGDPETSYTAKLFARGTEKIAQKLGEEATEVVIEAVQGKRKELTSESADLLYHILVLWADQDVKPKDVFDELARRRGLSGIEEKKARKKLAKLKK